MIVSPVPNGMGLIAFPAYLPVPCDGCGLLLIVDHLKLQPPYASSYLDHHFTEMIPIAEVADQSWNVREWMWSIHHRAQPFRE